TPTQSGVAKPYTYTGLSATTTYDYYVRADCSGSGNGSSTWAGPYSFTTPVACPAPTSLSSSSVTTTTATITWTKGDAETSWEIAVQADGTGTPSSGTVVNTTATYNATSLSSNTAYEVYVRATCGGANGNSTWVGPHDFTTLCATQTPTYTQSFATWLDNCWEEGTGAISGPTSTGSSNWQADGFANSGSSGSAKTNFYSTGDKEWLLTPIFDLTGGGFEITVDVALTDFNSTSRSDNFATDDAVHLMQSIDGGSTWTTAHTWNNANSNLPSTSGDNVIINISSVTSATTQFAIFAIETTGSTGNRDMDFFVDNFTVQAQPACPQPSSLTATNITSSAADLGWTNGGGANETAWDIEYGASGFTQGAGTMVTGTSSNPHSLSGLSANTTYDFYVRSDCGATDGSSNWVGPYTFTTSCGINSVPYFEGFESGYTNQTTVGTCLSQESVSGTQTWTANSSLTSYNRTPNTGSWNAYLRYSNTDWMFIPMSLTGGVSYTTELYARQDYSSTSYANITISYGTGNTAADMTNSIVAATGITNGSYQKVSGTFTPTTSGTYYVGIKGYVSGSPYYMSMDDISIYETPCPVTTVTGAVAHNAGTVTADMECTGSDGWTHYWNSTSNKLVLSLKKNGNSIGTIGDGTFTVSITDNGSASFYTDGTGFINTGVGGVLMDRKWDVTATTQPTTNVDVRFYYTAQNYTDVNTEITAQGGTALIAHTQINFFKVTSGEDPFVVANLSTSDVIIITNGTSASTTKWVAGTFNSDYYAEYQVTSFSGGGGGGASGGVSLPVELTAFSAQADGEVNHLEWTTASEKNNAYFDIERSTNGMDFETIGQVEGNGTTTTVSNYSFTDEMPATVTYYRLRQVDNDHNFNYSHTIVVERNQVGNDKLSLYPVPVTDYLTVEYNTALEEEMTISIIDNNGRLVIQKVIITGQGENQFLINCSNLPAGSYFVRLESATKNISHIIIKQ
ncbi:MAG: fibronectin type III domain-containing protein, partial [Saprospiraceae bacterium]